jgi:hypothetical protein
MRKIPAIAAGLLFATAAATASAQVYYERTYTYDPYYGSRTIDSNSECWNPRAGHFEQVRPGEVQNDLDFSRCRGYGSRYDNSRTTTTAATTSAAPTARARNAGTRAPATTRKSARARPRATSTSVAAASIASTG